MSEMMQMFCYCAEQKENYVSDNPEEQTATRKMFDILARAYAREVLLMCLNEAKGVK